MSRRVSLLAKENKQRAVVRFTDDLVFLDNVREDDTKALDQMLRRTSLKLDINALGPSGMSPLHEAAINGNSTAVSLLIKYGADPNRKDLDLWTPLHAACANGNTSVVKKLLDKGADIFVLTGEGESPLDIVDVSDFRTAKILLAHTKKLRKKPKSG